MGTGLWGPPALFGPAGLFLQHLSPPKVRVGSRLPVCRNGDARSTGSAGWCPEFGRPQLNPSCKRCGWSGGWQEAVGQGGCCVPAIWGQPSCSVGTPLTQPSPLLAGCLLTEESFSLKCPKHKVSPDLLRAPPPMLRSPPGVGGPAFRPCVCVPPPGTPCSTAHPPRALSPTWQGASQGARHRVPGGIPGHPGPLCCAGFGTPPPPPPTWFLGVSLSAKEGGGR